MITRISHVSTSISSHPIAVHFLEESDTVSSDNIKVPLSFHFSRFSRPCSLSVSSYTVCCSLLTILVALCWTHSCISMSFFSGEDKNRSQYSRCSLNLHKNHKFLYPIYLSSCRAAAARKSYPCAPTETGTGRWARMRCAPARGSWVLVNVPLAAH